MFPSFLTLEACLQQVLDLRPPRPVCKAEFDPAEQQLRGLLCATSGPMPAQSAARRRRVTARRRAAAGAILFHCGGLDLSPEPAFPHKTR